MNLNGFAGIYWLDGRIYLDGQFIDPTTNDPIDDYHITELCLHELIHHCQRLEHGYVGFWLKCIGYCLWYGYWDSPFERDARDSARYLVNITREKAA